MKTTKKSHQFFLLAFLLAGIFFFGSCNPSGESTITNNLDFAYITSQGTQMVAATRDGYMQIPATAQNFIEGECYFVAYVYSVGKTQNNIIIPDFFRAISENGEAIPQSKLNFYSEMMPEINNEYPIFGINDIYFAPNDYLGNRWLIPTFFKGISSKETLKLHAFYIEKKQTLPENIVLSEKYAIIDLYAELLGESNHADKTKESRRNFVVDLTPLKIINLSSSTQEEKIRIFFRYHYLESPETGETPVLKEKIIGGNNMQNYYMILNNKKNR